MGRGAVDMKGELAARAVALAALARDAAASERATWSWSPRPTRSGTRRTSACPGSCGSAPDLRCDFALNEGGGILLELADGRRVVTVSVGEKQVTSLRLRVFGRAGHASVPARADNAAHPVIRASCQLT